MNQDLNKAADNAASAFGRWKKQMQREGHTKRESLDPTQVDPETFSPSALALWYEYRSMADHLEEQAIVCHGFEGGTKTTQPRLDEPDKNKRKRKGTDNVIDLSDSFRKLVEGTPTIELPVTRYKDFIKADAYETLKGDRPSAQHLIEHDGKMYVVVQVIDSPGLEPCILANEAIKRTSWSGLTYASADQMAEGISGGGLQFTYKRVKYVVGGKDTRIILTTKDPLADVVAASEASVDEPLVVHEGATEIQAEPDPGTENHADIASG